MGERFPVLDIHFQSSIPDLYVIGNLAGTPDVKAALNAGFEVAHHIASQPRPQRPVGDYEVVIIGAGPAGVNAALELQKRGIRHRILESRYLFAQIRTFDKAMPLYRAVTGYPNVKGELWFGDCTVEQLLERWTRALEGRALSLSEGEEVLDVRRTDLFTVTSSRRSYLAERVILAVGRPLILSRLGLEAEVEPKVLYRPPDPCEHEHRRIVILGATHHSTIAAVQLSARNRVTMVFSEPDLGHLSPEVRLPAEVLATDGRLDLFPRSTLGGISRDHVNVKQPDREITVANDLVFPFTGVLKAQIGDGASAPAMLRKVGIRLENAWDRGRWISFAAVSVMVLAFYLAKKKWPGVFSLEGHQLLAFLSGFTALMVAVAFSPWRRTRDTFQNLVPVGPVLRHVLVWGALPMGLALAGLTWIRPGWFSLARRDLSGLYPLIYCILVTVFGTRAIFRYRDPLQTRKYLSLIFFQTFLFGILPEFLLNHRWLGYTLAYAWPLALSPATLKYYWDPTLAGLPPDPSHLYFIWAALLSLVVLPMLVMFTGKGYCSWVCGCGGLAETVGDTWRHHSPKGKANIAREIQIFYVLAITAALTAVAALAMFAGIALGGTPGRVLGKIADVAGMIYGYSVDLFLIAIIPIACYPFFGGKVWCRYWCPTAAAMHLLSRWFGRKGLSRYRIDADKERCIACNMCSRFCEVGIDVRRFALKGESFDNVNSSCIGCGICISVCPTGVLKFGDGLIQISIPPGSIK